MNYLLSTKYKLGKVQVEDNTVVHGGNLYAEWQGKSIVEVIRHYKSKLSKTDIKEKRYLPRFIPIEEVSNADESTATGSKQTQNRPTKKSEAV
jgi:hypothetical protein